MPPKAYVLKAWSPVGGSLLSDDSIMRTFLDQGIDVLVTDTGLSGTGV